MYEVPEIKKFSLIKYYSKKSKAAEVIHPSWPIFSCIATDSRAKELISLLEKSISLSKDEKLRVLCARKLSSFQVDKLIQVFVDEQEEFRKLMSTEKDSIYELVQKTASDWNYVILPKLIIGPAMDCYSK